MPNKNIDVSKYTRYFNITAPSAQLQTFMLVVLGAGVGLCSGFIINIGNPGYNGYLLYTAAGGIMAVTLPALLTSIVIKGFKWKLRMRHAMYPTTAVSAIYALAFIIVAMVYSIFKHYLLASILLILINAGIYGYWFLINKVAMGYRRSSVLLAAVQPVLNILFFIPFGQYIFALNLPLNAILLKLYGGMLVFLAFGYLVIYLIDRPAKKSLDISGIAVFNAMVQQWLLDVNPRADLLGKAGQKRDVGIDILVLKGRGHKGAVLVKPDIHYGPFSSVGGSVATEQIGRFIEQRYGAVPFVMHGAVSAGDNPVSANQITSMKRQIGDAVDVLMREGGRPASGSFALGRSGKCRALNMRINGVNLLTLSKAPYVTEDIDRDVGLELARCAGNGGSKVMLIDAHNSRFESAPGDELRGIYKGSKYVEQYRNAIIGSSKSLGERAYAMRFGAACTRLKPALHGKKDLGEGYTSVGIFEFGKRRFGIIYFDSNNMLPGFRNEVINHMKEKFGLDMELCTTDTHAVNSIALPASNALGRETKPSEVMPTLDRIVGEASDRLERVAASHSTITMRNFSVWGRGADEVLVKAGKDAIRTFKHTVPFVIAACFVAAAWVIYIL
jgi:predicted neutral ceramidase superfamily lipid hydrolase